MANWPPGAVRTEVPAYQAEVAESVPVLRPRLPSTDRLVPYLRRIDASRLYSNHGPLSTELGTRLAHHLMLPPRGVTCANSGTAALTGAILATAGRAAEPRTMALLPAFTFVASAFAAEACGYRPYLVDIDPGTWLLNPERLLDHPQLAEAGLVMPVATFGRTIPQAPWVRFRSLTGIPVVIDGAASFDGIARKPSDSLGAIPVALSFHATKAFGAGEGGGVASTDCGLIRDVVRALNFGFYGERNAETAGINGKMSEYHAAVGLAELDGWHEKQRALQSVIDDYRACMGEAGVAERFIGAPDVGLTYALFRCTDPEEADQVQASLLRHRVGVRLWYSTGLHRQSHFAASSRDNLTVTEAVAPCLLGLPMAPDLAPRQIVRVVQALADGVAQYGSVRDR
jgi:dTDP-4-amino-4,6-dideoxygalactose transaminase